MSVESNDFPAVLRAHVELQGAFLTTEEMSHVRDRYPRCSGKGVWDVREYASVTAVGAREYRVVRGSGTQDVYRSRERGHASAVRTALNEIESGEASAKPVQNSDS